MKRNQKPRNYVVAAFIKNPARNVGRHNDRRAKAKAVRKIKHTLRTKTSEEYREYALSPKNVGKAAVQHGTCGCWMCKCDYCAPKFSRNGRGWATALVNRDLHMEYIDELLGQDEDIQKFKNDLLDVFDGLDDFERTTHDLSWGDRDRIEMHFRQYITDYECSPHLMVGRVQMYDVTKSDVEERHITVIQKDGDEDDQYLRTYYYEHSIGHIVLDRDNWQWHAHLYENRWYDMDVDRPMTFSFEEASFDSLSALLVATYKLTR